MEFEATDLPAGSDEKSKAPKTVEAEEGSKSDPQLSELDGLKKGGVDPHVHPQDEPRDSKGKKDL